MHQKKIKHLLFLLSLTALFHSDLLHAQIFEGFAGRKIILKTDLLQGNALGFRNIETEILILKNLSVNIGYRKYIKNNLKEIGKGYSFKGEPTSEYPFYEFNALHSEPRYYVKDWKASINFNLVDIGMRFYFKNTFYGAPQGTYFFYNHTRGNGDLKGSGAELNQYTFQSYQQQKLEYVVYKPYVIENVKLAAFQLGLGYQSVWNNFITFDFGACITRTKVSHAVNAQEELLKLTGPYYGYYLFNTAFQENNTDIFSPSTQPRLRNLGFNAYFKIGYLIF